MELMTPKKLIAISDIHGSYEALRQLVNEDYLKDGYTIVFMGDYIGYGKQSIEVIQYLIYLKKKYGEQVILLYGNWEDMLQIALFDKNREEKSEKIKVLYKRGFANDFKSINNNFDLKNMFNYFFTQLQMYYTVDDYCFVHAGVNIDALLNGESLENVLEKSSKEDLLWNLSFIDDLSIIKNPFIITNPIGEFLPNDPSIKHLYHLHDLFADNIDKTKYNLVVGHVPVQYLAKDLEIELNTVKPIVFGPVLAIDFGASKPKGHQGYLGYVKFDENGKRTYRTVPLPK